MRKCLIGVENLSMSFGTRELFDIDRLEIYEGDRIGLVGLNGSGKTTLLKILMGEITPDEGRVRIHCEPRYFTQLNEERENTATAVELSLFGVQELTERDEVSGGEDTRLRLAELFSEDTELYILDEPTSHLDVEGANYLNNRLAMTDSFILVSHNRELLDCNCNKIIEIDGGRIKEFTGNYTEYLEQKKKAYEHAVEEYEQYTEEVKRLTKVYAKKREKARKLEKDPRGISKSEAKGIATMALRRSPEGKANVLILDEPTNYLDIPSVEAIQELLMEYEGTMLFVSHDNEFVKAIATDVIRIENMKLINEIR